MELNQGQETESNGQLNQDHQVYEQHRGPEDIGHVEQQQQDDPFGNQQDFAQQEVEAEERAIQNDASETDQGHPVTNGEQTPFDEKFKILDEMGLQNAELYKSDWTDFAKTVQLAAEAKATETDFLAYYSHLRDTKKLVKSSVKTVFFRLKTCHSVFTGQNADECFPKLDRILETFASADTVPSDKNTDEFTEEDEKRIWDEFAVFANLGENAPGNERDFIKYFSHLRFDRKMSQKQVFNTFGVLKSAQRDIVEDMADDENDGTNANSNAKAIEALSPDNMRILNALIKTASDIKTSAYKPGSFSYNELEQFVKDPRWNSKYWLLRKAVAAVSFFGGITSVDLIKLKREGLVDEDKGIKVEVERPEFNRIFYIPRKHPGLNTFCWYTLAKEYLDTLISDTGSNEGPLFCNPRANPGRSGSMFTQMPTRAQQLSYVGIEIAKTLRLGIPNLYHDKCWITSAEDWEPWRKYQVTQYDLEQSDKSKNNEDYSGIFDEPHKIKAEAVDEDDENFFDNENDYYRQPDEDDDYKPPANKKGKFKIKEEVTDDYMDTSYDNYYQEDEEEDYFAHGPNYPMPVDVKLEQGYDEFGGYDDYDYYDDDDQYGKSRKKQKGGRPKSYKPRKPKIESDEIEAEDFDKEKNEWVCSQCPPDAERFKQITDYGAHWNEAHYEAPEGTSKFQCPVCKKEMQTRNVWSSHAKAVHLKAKKPCRICGLLFKYNTVDSHIREFHKVNTAHAPGTVFKCDFCDFQDDTKKKLTCHYKKYHRKEYEARLLKCPYCPDDNKAYTMRYTKKSDLDDHIRNQHRDIDHGIPKLECEKCGKQFSKQWKMKAHVCTIQCDHCDKVYPTRNGLFSHIRTAHPGMGYGSARDYATWMCDHCSKTFPKEPDLKRHMKVDHGIVEGDEDASNPSGFVCHVCNGHFKSEMILKSHMIVHESPKNPDGFTCDECGKGFTRKEALKEHVLTKHKNEANYQCDHCPLKFGTKSALNHHVNAQRTFNCEICGKGLKGRHTMRYHMKTQHNAIPKGSVQCDFCVEGFLLEGLRVQHMKNKHPVEFNEKYNTPEMEPPENYQPV